MGNIFPTSVKQYGTLGKGRSAPENTIIKGLKAIHLLAAVAWAGGALSLQALSYIKLTTSDTGLASAAAYCLHFVDTWLVIPGLALCALTGLVYSVFTSIGFFKFFWIGYKWAFTCCAGFWGFLFWMPWGNRCIEYLSPYGLDWILLLIRGCLIPENMWQGALQVLVILAVCLISVYRPLTLRATSSNMSPVLKVGYPYKKPTISK